MIMRCSHKYAVAFPSRDVFALGLSPSFYNGFKEFKDIYDFASEIVKEDLYKLSYVEKNTRPDMQMVCLLTHCFGIYTVLMKYLSLPSAAVGFSQGEFTAVTASNSLGLQQTLELVKDLESVVYKDELVKQGSMARIIELDRSVLEKCCRDVDPSGKYICVGIRLSKDQNVISGDSEYINRVCKSAKENGARWIIPLMKNFSFHSPLCLNIMNKSKEYFNKYNFQQADYPVHSCASGNDSVDGDVIKDHLSKQVSNPIRWDEIILSLNRKGVNQILELGPGCTVSGNSRIICPDMSYCWINNASEIDDYLKSLI